MTGIDTNVLVRYLAQDDPAQSRQAKKLFESLSIEQPGFISLVVLVELVWVLRSLYKTQALEVSAILEGLLRSKEIRVERTETAWRALREFQTAKADFSDCMISELAAEAGCAHTITFDKKAASLAGFRLLR